MIQRRLLAALAGAAAIVAVARASTVEALSDEDLVARARTIVHASVTRVHVEWDESHTRTFTLVDLAPAETLKGDAAPVVTLKIPGGQKDGIVTIVHGMPTFSEGEEVVVFVSEAHPTAGTCVPVGLGQGKWKVERDERGNRIARRSLGGAKLVTKDGTDASDAAKKMRTERALDDLLSDVRAEVAKQKKAKDASKKEQR